MFGFVLLFCLCFTLLLFYFALLSFSFVWFVFVFLCFAFVLFLFCFVLICFVWFMSLFYFAFDLLCFVLLWLFSLFFLSRSSLFPHTHQRNICVFRDSSGPWSRCLNEQFSCFYKYSFFCCPSCKFLTSGMMKDQMTPFMRKTTRV